MAKPKTQWEKTKTAASGLWDTVTDLTPWGSTPEEKAGDTGKPRSRAAPSPTWTDAGYAAANFLDPRQGVRLFLDTVRGIPSLVNGQMLASIQDAGLGAQMEARRKRNEPVDVKWYRSQLPVWSRNSYSDKQIQKMMAQSTRAWNVLGNNFSYVDPKTGERNFDWRQLAHKAVTHPREVALLFSGIGEGASTARLSSLTKAGRLGPEADILSNTGRTARRIQNASRTAATIADPLTTLAIKGGTKAAVRAVDVAKRTFQNPVTSILNPDFVSAFEQFKADRISDLVYQQGMSPRQARAMVNQNRDNLFYEFNKENNGLYRNPYNQEVTKMFEAQGKNPEAYGAPSIYHRVNQKFNRSGGPSPASLRQVTLESAQVPSPRRSATTLEAPHPSIAQNDKNWINAQQQNLTNQLQSTIGAKYPGQQFDFDALAAHNPNPTDGSTMGGYVYRENGGWHSPSGVRAGDVMQPYLTDQYRLQSTPPNISQADLDFIHRNRAASNDLAASDLTVHVPQPSNFDRGLSLVKSVGSPLASAFTGYMATGSPLVATGLGVAGAGADIARGVRKFGAYLDETGGAPFNYNPDNPFLQNNALVSRALTRAPAALSLEGPVPPPPPPPPAPPKPAAQQVPPVVENRDAIVLPEIKQENPSIIPAAPTPMPTQELKPEVYDLSIYGLNQQEDTPRMYGGRTAYKKGGAVSPNVESLVQKLMGRYKAVKKAQDNKTKPLLEQPDEAIVKALSVAQKAI